MSSLMVRILYTLVIAFVVVGCASTEAKETADTDEGDKIVNVMKTSTEISAVKKTKNPAHWNKSVWDKSIWG